MIEMKVIEERDKINREGGEMGKVMFRSKQEGKGRGGGAASWKA